MNYSINKNNYRDFNVIELNKLDARAYFIPYKDEKLLSSSDILSERYNSDMVKVLSGEWDFKYYHDISLLQDNLDTNTICFDKIKVPSTWQRTGYQAPIYLNARYEFHLNPPELPKEMSVAVYRKTFEKPNNGKNFILSFLGVTPCIDVYLNGEFIGYSEGSHNTAEFDITDKVIDGENELLCVVHRWSVGTYLECQDMFRETGIFRDVLLYCFDDTYINDFEVKTKKQNNGNYNLSVNSFIKGNTEDCNLKLKVLDKNNNIICKEKKKVTENNIFSFENLDVNEWSAEIPEVYFIYLSLEKNGDTLCSTRQVIGFKTVRIDGETFKFNEMPIKMKGVNHHDSNPETGYVLTADNILKDIAIMKEYNINTVRTSHYPPDPIFLTLADIYGLYVIDEADIETHGTCSIGPKKLSKPNLISDDKKWEKHYIDRVYRMYKRDRNHPSITMWSLGNEAGGYQNQDACYKMLKTYCPEIPIHYEGVIRTKRFAYDVVSEMYTEISDVVKCRDGVRGKKYKGKPFLLCEYAHAMGVGPGNLEDYWKVIYSSDKLMGGCIWEFCDHAVKHNITKNNYKYQYTYGGDHNEPMHDGNFCVDGLFYPNRTPHTGALEMKEVYRPIRAEKFNNNTFNFKNTNCFLNTNNYTIKWSFVENAKEISSGNLSLDIKPLESKVVELPIEIKDDKKDYILNITYLDNKTKNIVAHEQFILTDNDYAINIDKKQQKPSLKKFDNQIKIDGSNCSVVFNTKTGELSSYFVNGKELINTKPFAGRCGFVPNIYRAAIDNETYAWHPKWNRDKLKNTKSIFVSIDSKEIDNFALIEVKHKIIVDNSSPLFYCTVFYKIYNDATIEITANLLKRANSPKDLPRFGVTIELPKDLRKAIYYGRGSAENVSDFNIQSPIGLYCENVIDMHENYIKPQDNGNHSDVKYLRLTDNSGNGIEIAGNSKFSFSVHEYTQNLLTKAKHREDLYDQNTTFLSLDGFMRGAGSNACGPDTLEEHRFNFKKHNKFSFTIKPYFKK